MEAPLPSATDNLTPEQKAIIDALNKRADELGLRAKLGEKVRVPGVVARAWDFAKNATRHVATGLKTVSDEERDRRLAICQGCEFFDQEKDLCKKCGCKGRMFRTKLSWADQKCPLTPPKW